MTDIVDQIDALVDEQLSGGEPCTGYNYGDPTYPKCPHCQRHWHGLPITERIAQMYAAGVYDPEYLVAEDDSRVLCEGSEFIGPMPPPYGLGWRTYAADVGVLGVLECRPWLPGDDTPIEDRSGVRYPGWIEQLIDATLVHMLGAAAGILTPEAARAVLLGPYWHLPDDPFDPASWGFAPVGEISGGGPSMRPYFAADYFAPVLGDLHRIITGTA